jgi:predicted O-methyltransferase YrrM
MNWEAAWSYIKNVEGLLGGGLVERWLFEMARSLPDRTVILEIGAYLGRSTSCLAFGCTRTEKRVYSIDTFCGNETDFISEDFFETWQHNINSCGLGAYVHPLKGWSRSFYETWCQPIHFLFLDGSHQFEDIVADFDAFFPHVIPGGCVALHDVAMPGEKRAHPGRDKAWHEHIAPRLCHIDRYPIAHGWRKEK